MQTLAFLLGLPLAFIIGCLLISKGFLTIHEFFSVYYGSYEQALSELNHKPLDIIIKELAMFLLVSISTLVPPPSHVACQRQLVLSGHPLPLQPILLSIQSVKYLCHIGRQRTTSSEILFHFEVCNWLRYWSFVIDKPTKSGPTACTSLVFNPLLATGFISKRKASLSLFTLSWQLTRQFIRHTLGCLRGGIVYTFCLILILLSLFEDVYERYVDSSTEWTSQW